MESNNVSMITPAKRNGIYVPPYRRNENENVILKPTSLQNHVKLPVTDFDKKAFIKKSLSNLFTQRVTQLANVYLKLEFKKQLPDIYKQEYSEELPLEWIKSIQLSTTLTYLDLSEILVESAKTEINDVQSNKISSQTQKIVRYVPLGSIKPLSLDPKLLEKGFWIDVYSCQDVCSIYGAILTREHFGQVEKLAESMNNYYNVMNAKCDTVIQGGIYAIKDGFWHRVKALKIDNLKVTVFFIDRGDTDIVDKNKLQKLSSKFLSLPSQALKISLTNLEVFEDLDGLKNVLETLLIGKQIHVKFDEYKNKSLTAHLYAKDGDDKINLNEFIMSQIIDKFLDHVHFIKLDNLMPCQISYVSEQGKICLRLKTKSLVYFERLIKVALDKITCDKSYAAVKYDSQQIYFVFDDISCQWYRACVVRFTEENRILVDLIDIGSRLVISRKNCISLDKMFKFLTMYPAQAIEVTLNQLYPLQKNQIFKLQELTSQYQSFYVKFKALSETKVPVVQLFLKNKDTVISINDSLRMLMNKSTPIDREVRLDDEDEISIKIFRNEANVTNGRYDDIEIKNEKSISLKDEKKSCTKSKVTLMKEEYNKVFSKIETNDTVINIITVDHRHSNTIGKILNCPNISVSNYVDVHVLLVTDPSNFAVQLLSSKNGEFKEMKDKMNKIYKTYESPKLTMETVQIGQMYAINSDDDKQWFRIYLLEKINTEMVYVYFCDYGYYKNVNIKQLKVLHNRFYNIPYQAIWCSLYGVKSPDKEWSEETIVRFKDLVQGKNLVCYVETKKNLRGIQTNKSIPLTVEFKMEIELVDTSTDEDIYISHLLVNEKRVLISCS